MRRGREAILSISYTVLIPDFFGANFALESHDSRDKDGAVHESMLIVIHGGDQV